MPIAPEVAKEKLCLALDVDSAKQAVDLVRALKDYIGLFKIGLQLYTSEGPSIVKAIVDVGAQVFLDLKFHDIPNTAVGAGRSTARLGVAMFNVHAVGGMEMMSAIREAVEKEAGLIGKPRPKILAVTVLTSINDEILQRELLIHLKAEEYVVHLAKLTQQAGLDGVVASPKETPLIRQACGKDFLIVTPGIRPAWEAAGDQKRITTPREAIDLGSDYIVVGRPITAAKDPVEAAKNVLAEIS